MRHWLQAEQELASSRSGQSNGSTVSAGVPSRNSDVTPLQGTRAASAASASRENKRANPGTPASVGGEKNGNGSGQAAKRKPASAPAL